MELEEKLLAEIALQEETGKRISLTMEHLQTHESIAIRSQENFYPASTIKIPIMAEAFRQAELGNFKMHHTITVYPEDLVGGSGILKSLSAPKEYSIEDLITLMIIVSDNTATNVLIELLGPDQITNYMQSLGLKNTTVYNKLMIVPTERKGANATTTGDLSHLLTLMAEGKLVSQVASDRMIAIMKKQQHTERIPGQFPPKKQAKHSTIPRWQVAIKSGTVNNICHDVGLIFLPEQTWSLAIFTEGYPEPSEGSKVIAHLSRIIFDHYEKVGQ